MVKIKFRNFTNKTKNEELSRLPPESLSVLTNSVFVGSEKSGHSVQIYWGHGSNFNDSNKYICE